MGTLFQKNNRWYYRYSENGKRHDKALSPDKATARQQAAQIDRSIDRSKLGYDDNALAEHLARPLNEHLADWKQSLLDKGATIKHAEHHAHRAEVVLHGCGFSRISDLDAGKVEKYLAARRRQNITKKDKQRARGFGIKTSNHHLRAIKGFSRWLWHQRRQPSDPLVGLRLMNAETDKRHVRRVLSADDLQALLKATRQSSRTDAGDDWQFTGEDRFLLYLTACYTGLRASELASLTPSNFNFGKRTLTVDARHSKHRKQDVLPLHAELVGKLKPYIASRKLKATDRIWGGSWASNNMGGKLLKRDLKACGIAYRNDAAQLFDFHALRSQYITTLVLSGVSPKVAQKLARHSSIDLTMNVYTKLGVDDLGNELAKLPSLTGD